MKFLAVTVAAAIVAASITPMAVPEQLAHALAEMAKRAARTPVEQEKRSQSDLVREACEKLRAPFEKHPKQKRLYTSKAKLKATRKTRRAGATAGGVRELLARALEIPGFRATYVTTTRDEAIERAWLSDTKSGLIDVLNQLASKLDLRGVDKYMLGGIIIEVRKDDLELNFSNGSQIQLFGADTERAINKKRGGAKHVFWIDEVQDFRFLEDFYGGVVVAALQDFDGECWLSGTPGRDAAGMFYEITRDDGEEIDGWEVHEIAQVDNPFFGVVMWEGGQWFVLDNLKVQHGPYATEAEAEEAAVKIRWDRTAGEAIRKNRWHPEHPDLLRECYGKWVKGDTRHVYPVGMAPPNCKLIFAPQRLTPNTFRPEDPPWYDHERAVLDLPLAANRRPYEWLYAIGIDFGNFPAPFAIVVWAFTYDRPDIFEMFSWKATRVVPDDQRVYVDMLWNTLPNVVVFVADPAGREGELEAWRTRFNLPIDDADKANKDVYREIMAGDIRRGVVHYRGTESPRREERDYSPLLDEHRHLVYLPTKPGQPRKEHANRKLAAEGDRVPGNHCSDGGLYAHRHLGHHLHREKPPDTRTEHQRKEHAYEAEIDRAERIRERLEAEYGYNDGGYEY